MEQLVVSDNPLATNNILRLYCSFRFPTLVTITVLNVFVIMKSSHSLDRFHPRKVKLNDLSITLTDTKAGQAMFANLRDHWMNPTVMSGTSSGKLESNAEAQPPPGDVNTGLCECVRIISYIMYCRFGRQQAPEHGGHPTRAASAIRASQNALDEGCGRSGGSCGEFNCRTLI